MISYHLELPQAAFEASLLRSAPIRALVVVASLMLLFILHQIESYVGAYVCFAAFALLCLTAMPGHLRLLHGAIAAYTLLAFLNISSWRGYITVESLRVAAGCMLALWLPALVLSGGSHVPPTPRMDPSRLGRKLLLAHVLLSYAGVLAAYGTVGPIILDQALRFNLPPAIEYLIRSTLPLAPFVPYLYRSAYAQVAALLTIVLPTILIGGRGTAIAAVGAYLVSLRMTIPRRLSGKEKTLIVASAMMLAVMFATLFYLRRGGTSQLLSADELVRFYFDYDGWWVRALLPFYLGVREAGGLMNTIVVQAISNNQTDWPLVFADINTLLPGTQLASGQALARILGAVERGGLTPGLIGGLYLDFRGWSWVGFLLLGVLLSAGARLVERRPRYFPALATILTSTLHLYHRGFVKPEYITSAIIALVYTELLCRRVRFARAPSQGLRTA